MWGAALQFSFIIGRERRHKLRQVIDTSCSAPVRMAGSPHHDNLADGNMSPVLGFQLFDEVYSYAEATGIG